MYYILPRTLCQSCFNCILQTTSLWVYLVYGAIAHPNFYKRTTEHLPVLNSEMTLLFHNINKISNKWEVFYEIPVTRNKVERLIFNKMNCASVYERYKAAMADKNK